MSKVKLYSVAVGNFNDSKQSAPFPSMVVVMRGVTDRTEKLSDRFILEDK